jgi:hypothetical protein
MIETLCTSIAQGRVIRFFYKGLLRVVEPHCYGVTTAGNEALRGFQIQGSSSTGELGWKLFNMTKVTKVEITTISFNGARPRYNRNDQKMRRIYCQL